MSGYAYADLTPPETLTMSGCWQALVAEAPADLTDTLMVTIPGFNPEMQFGPCRWMPRVTAQTINVAEGAETADDFTVAAVALPARGDLCLVIFDDQGECWVPCWWPA